MTEPEERPSAIPASARRDSIITLALLGITALLYLLSVPWAFAMIVTGPVAAVFGIRALYRSRSASGVTAFRVWMGGAILFSLFSILMGVTFMVFSDVITDLRDCTQRAVTQQARAECQTEYDEGVTTTVEDIFGDLGVTLPD